MQRRCFAWFAVPLLAVAGCGQLIETLLEDEYEDLPVKNEAGVLSISRQFGDAIQQENYPAAYQLLTNSRRAEQSLEQFTATCKQQRQFYFEQTMPTKVDAYAYMPFPDEWSDWEGLPADAKYDSLLGVGTVIWGRNDEEEPYVNEVDVVIVDEAGQPKIAHIDWDDAY